MYVFDGVLDPDLLQKFKIKIEDHFMQMVSKNYNKSDFYPTRNIMMNSDDLVVKLTKDFLESKLKIKLNCYQFELQTWPVEIFSSLHKHDTGLRSRGDYNSILYLNDNFDGGEFYTENGITIKPKTNRLILFDGKNINHGVKTVRKNHRYTMIFWWENTEFY